MRKRTQGKRRSAAEWSKLVAAWRRSGQTAKEYAARRGIKAETLVWWRWHLSQRKTPELERKRPAGAKPRLVAVELQRETAGVCESSHCWEIEDPRGLILRVNGPLSADELREVLTALTKESPSA